MMSSIFGFAHQVPEKKTFFMSLLRFLAFISGHFQSPFLVLLLQPLQNRTSDIQHRDSKSKRDTKNSILI